MPFVVSVGVLRDEVDGDLIVLDCDSVEIQCVDQILHLAVDDQCRVYAFEQSRGLSRVSPCNLPANIFTTGNLQRLVQEIVAQRTSKAN